MSAKSKKSSAAIDRPFDKKLMAQARAIAEHYQVILAFEDGRWYGRGLELSHTFGEGTTPDRCVADTRKAFAVSVAYMLERHQKPPAPASEGMRTKQVNVRLTDEEKALLEATARGKGFKGLSDFIRNVALESANGKGRRR